MGDVGDYWREHREYRRSKGLPASSPRPPAKLVQFKPKHERAGWRWFTNWHWQLMLHGDLLDYWPSKGKWRYRGETYDGGWGRMEKFIAQQQPKEPTHGND